MRACIGIALLATAAASQAQITKVSGGYLLRVQYKKGQVITMKTVNSISGWQQGSKPVDATMPIVMKITDVSKEEATAKVTVGPLSMNGTAMNNAQTVEMVFDRLNRAKTTNAPAFIGAQLPVKPIKVGSTWAAVAPIPDQLGTGKNMKATYKFQGLKVVDGKSMGVLSYVLTGGVSGSGTILLLATDGSIYSNKGLLTFNGPSGAIRVTSTLTRA